MSGVSRSTVTKLTAMLLTLVDANPALLYPKAGPTSRTASSEAATVVFMSVGSKSGAWKCFVTPQGKFDGIEEVEGRSNDDSAGSAYSGGKSSGGLPFFNATCPGAIDVHAEEGGYVYFNGKQATLKKINREYYEAAGSGITLSIAINPDETVTLTYTGKHGANGVCEVTDSD
jgi:hypothetical protein